MTGNSFGKALILTSWGESHGPAIGGVLDGLPAGAPLDFDCVAQDLARRRPGQHLTSARSEPDVLEILSGVFQGKTTGTPLSFLIRNEDQRSADYAPYAQVFRPGHGDYVYQQKYGHVDYRGGGRASARETVVRVAAGSIVKQILKMCWPDFHVTARLMQIGSLKRDFDEVLHAADPQDLSPAWRALLTRHQNEGTSVGAIIEGTVIGAPAGLGAPVYDKLDADLAKAIMSINAVKGVEIGDGFASVSAPTGYDEMGVDANQRPFFYTNKAGGILAGISTGQPICLRVAFKPTSSTQQPRSTITHDNAPTTLQVTGRHDPCVALRALPIVEAMMTLVIGDHAIRSYHLGTRFLV